uniref:Uncharacterized protein n=1 Tax=Solanum lycopersicum TaxID=4081 RepID=K4BWU7_SOLLC
MIPTLTRTQLPNLTRYTTLDPEPNSPSQLDFVLEPKLQPKLKTNFQPRSSYLTLTRDSISNPRMGVVQGCGIGGVSQVRQIANRFADPTTDKTPRLRARPNRAAQAASDKEADSQTEEAVATIAEVQHQEQLQAGGPAQEAAAEPVETGAKPGRANQGTQTVEQKPVIHSVKHMFFLLAKMVPLKQTKSREGTMAGISSPIRMRD